ncbi:MAG: sugar ABC transporter ATP-binding protein [Candidatus Wolframiiraptor sp. EX4484-121]|nr:MAG: sugar ABC transporter ATP-binding protein [Candidatus Wolframiiraptor sp. EX4484-121]
MSRVFIENLTKTFGETVAVKNLTLEIKDGEFVCLLGPSGSGKTTTLRCIAGLEKQDEGNIYIDDQIVNDLSPAERDVAMVFQFPVVYPGLTVKDNLEFPLKQRGYPKDEIRKKVLETAKMLRIDHLLDHIASDLNVGEKQRVALGRALVRRPKVLLLDEALTNLETELKLSMIAELKKLHEELNQTIIYVTHDQSEAMMMADRIAVMHLGVLQQYGTPEDLYHNPANLFVAGFIGSPPMNFLDVTYNPEKRKLSLDDFTLDVSKYAKLIEEKASGNDLVLGFRPEHLEIHEVCESESHLKGKVDFIEFMEDKFSLDIRVGDKIIKALVPSVTPVEPGAFVCIELKRFHIFDKKTEKMIM